MEAYSRGRHSGHVGMQSKVASGWPHRWAYSRGGVNVAPPTYWDKVDGLIYGCL